MNLYDLAKMEHLHPPAKLGRVAEELALLVCDFSNLDKCRVSLSIISHREGEILVRLWEKREIAAVVVIDKILFALLGHIGIELEIALLILQQIAAGRDALFHLALFILLGALNDGIEV